MPRMEPLHVLLQVDVLMVGSKEAGPDSALLVVLLAVVAVGVLDGLSQGAIFGDAADLPPAYTHVSMLSPLQKVVCITRTSLLRSSKQQ